MAESQLEEAVGICVQKGATYRNEKLCTLSADAIDVPCEHFNVEFNGTLNVRDATREDGYRPAICFGCDYIK